MGPTLATGNAGLQDQCSGNYRHYSIHLMFGREPRLPEDIMFGIPAEEYTSPEQYSHILVEKSEERISTG